MAKKKDTNPKKPLMNMRYERFVLEYITNGGNAAAAYRSVYNCNMEASHPRASVLLDRPEIIARIDFLRIKAFKRAHMAADETLAEMARIARCDIGDLVWKPGEIDAAGAQLGPNDPRVGNRKMLHEMPPEVRRCIKSIELTDDGYKIVLWDKDKQLTNLAKHHKIIDADQTNININLGFADKLRAAREKRLKQK